VFDPTWEFADAQGTPIPEMDGRTIEVFAQRYVEFFYELPAADHPHSNLEINFDRRRQLDAQQENFHRGEDETKAGSWNLVDSFTTGFYRTFLPSPRSWAIMFSPYFTMASTAEFPTLTTQADLEKFVNNDTGRVTQLEAKINGVRLNPVRVKTSVEIDIRGGNVLELNPQQNVKVVIDGFFELLKPLPLGDFLIESTGISPNYENRVRYAVYNRSPPL
jgi:hypothetical protein